MSADDEPIEVVEVYVDTTAPCQFWLNIERITDEAIRKWEQNR